MLKSKFKKRPMEEARQCHLRLIDKDLLRSRRLPNVPDADDGAAVQTHSTGFCCRCMDRQHGVPLDLREVQQADVSTCD